MQTIRRQAGSRGEVCATRGPLFYMCFIYARQQNRNCYWPSRLHHVGSSLFAAAMCRKFATAAAFSWHLPHHKNVAAINRQSANAANRVLLHNSAFTRVSMDKPRFRALAARCARVVQEPLAQNRGRGESRVSDAPVAARGVVNTRVSHHRFTGFIRLSPRNGFNGFLRALPGDRACLSPSPVDCSTDLTPASGRQDHTTSPSASAPFVRALSCTDAVASTASRTQRP